MPAQGWDRDPSGVHEDRWFSAGRPTPLVRDHGVVSREDLPPGEQPGRRDPVGPAAPAARDKFPAAAYYRFPAAVYYWPFWTVVVPCLVAFAAAGLIVASSLVSQPTNVFELARSAVAWVQADRAGQVVACLAAATLLIACGQRPRWRQAIALTMWGIVSLQIGLFLLSGSEYPGNSCGARPGWAAITLSDAIPGPVVTAPPGAHIVVTVPGWWFGTAADVSVDSGGILREECTISLPGGGRRTIFAAIKPGTTEIASGLEQGSPFFMPAWGGEVIVRGARD